MAQMNSSFAPEDLELLEEIKKNYNPALKARELRQALATSLMLTENAEKNGSVSIEAVDGGELELPTTRCSSNSLSRR